MLFDIFENNNDTLSNNNSTNNYVNSGIDYLGKHFNDIDLKRGVTHLPSNGRYSNYNLVEHILKKIGRADIVRFTYSIAPTGARTYQKLADNELINSFVLILDISARTRNKKALKLLKGFKTVFVSNHSKITLIKNDTYNITVLGSQNDNQAKRFESLIIFTDIRTFNFYNKIANGFITKKA